MQTKDKAGATAVTASIKDTMSVSLQSVSLQSVSLQSLENTMKEVVLASRELSGDQKKRGEGRGKAGRRPVVCWTYSGLLP